MANTRKRSRSKTRRGANRPTGRRPTGSTKRATREGPSLVGRAGARLGRHFATRKGDLLGIGLMVLASLTVLGLWFQAGGPFGKLFLVIVKGLFGPAGYAVPVL